VTLARYGNRKDANQGEIVQALKRVAASVFVMDEPCDLLVGFRGKNYLLEVKDPKKPPSKRRLTIAQADFRQTWYGQYAIVHSAEEALKVIGV